MNEGPKCLGKHGRQSPVNELTAEIGLEKALGASVGRQAPLVQRAARARVEHVDVLVGDRVQPRTGEDERDGRLDAALAGMCWGRACRW